MRIRSILYKVHQMNLELMRGDVTDLIKAKPHWRSRAFLRKICRRRCFDFRERSFDREEEMKGRMSSEHTGATRPEVKYMISRRYLTQSLGRLCHFHDEKMRVILEFWSHEQFVESGESSRIVRFDRLSSCILFMGSWSAGWLFWFWCQARHF